MRRFNVFRMLDTPIHVIDFEGSRQSGIVEYGVVTLVGDRIDSVQTRLCAPVGTISDIDRQQHGISESVASQEAPFVQEWTNFAAMRELGPFCAHNASVEDGFLRAVWSCPRTAPDFSEAGRSSPTWGPWMDTLHLYRRIYPGLASYKLADLILLFELQARLDMVATIHCPKGRQAYHSALYDALASALLLMRLYKVPDLEALSLRWLMLQSAPSAAARESMGQQGFSFL